MNYQELQVKVFNWLNSKYDKDSKFTFSVRQKANKGAELNYFIGTEKSKYFSTTFWNIPVAYPGSSSDLINLVFEIRDKNRIESFIQFNQTKNPHNSQNELALELIRSVKNKLRVLFPDKFYESSENNKMEFFKVSANKNYYTLEKLVPELDSLLEKIIPIVNKEIEVLKISNPGFIANRFTSAEQVVMLRKMEKRFENYGNKDNNDEELFLGAIQKLKTHNYLQNYYSLLIRLINDLELLDEDSRILFSVPKAKTMLNFIINQRYVWALHSSQAYKFISKIPKTDYYEEFSGNDKKILNYTNDFNIVLENYNEILQFAKEELDKNFQNTHSASSNFFFHKSIFDENYRNQIIGKIDFNSSNISQEMRQPLNQILFGPPGTGKTYHTINKAIQIINPEFDLSQDRQIIKAEYQRLVDEGRIVFTTFHQSMSYEDFIEGIKPEIEENEEGDKTIIYEIQDGIFKRLVKKTLKPTIESTEVAGQYSFDDAWNDLIKEANDNLEKNDSLFLSIQTPKLGLEIVDITEKGNLKLKPIYSEDAKEYTVSYSRADKLQSAFPDLTVIKNIDKEFRNVIGGSNSTAYWSVLNYINNKIKNNTKSQIIKNTLPPRPFVLIIDEINRGNVSQIFGELITLIEPDKRLGNPESLEIMLPYSKEKFGVPSNLYIIGTMNTADRSVEALDTALRRRFSFEEMPPKYDLEELEYEIAGFTASEILRTINTRIEKLIDKDHAIGHAYFIGKNEKTMIESFYKNIIPLLQEYFFGDYGKIGLVLGKGFVHIKEKQNHQLFAAFNYENESDYHDKINYKIIDYRTGLNVSEDMDFYQAVHFLMNFES